MLSFLITTIFLNSVSIPNPPFDPFYPPHPDVCAMSDKHNCLTSYYCGWCENKDGTGRCKVANPNGYGPLFAQDCHKWYQGGRTRVYYNMYPWYNPLRWIYWRWPQIRGVPYVVRHTGPRRWRFSRR